jgi:hypothetical protein
MGGGNVRITVLCKPDEKFSKTVSQTTSGELWYIFAMIAI